MMEFKGWRLALMFGVPALLAMACVFPLYSGETITPGMGALSLDIDYTGTWYVDTFGYTREADNIRHLALVMPEDAAERIQPASVFVSLEVVPNILLLREAYRDNAWAMAYLYDAPEGYLWREFEPGTYQLSVAILAAPLSREDAGVGDDVLLWPGVTGGGLSTEYQTIEIEEGEVTSLTVTLTDANGWACPWLYVFNGEAFERRTEILRNQRGADMAQTETTPLGRVTVVDGYIVVRVAEEKEETSYIDALALEIGGVTVQAEDAAALSAVDGEYLILEQGDAVELRFRVPETYTAGDAVSVVATGYYLPE